MRISLALQRAKCAVLYTLSAAACSPRAQSASTVSIVPTSHSVSLGTNRTARTLDVSIVITNTSANPILWSDCALGLEEYRYLLVPDRKGSDWTEVWSPGCPDLSAATSPLLQGESATVHLTAVAAADTARGFAGRPGIYRVHFFLSANVGGEYLQLPYAESVSQPFNVVAE
ncbi:MAG TPA: hypothetical protein VGO33_09700 [Gemmatimonadaceae bacterium]|jgi:hypothetical protein|nr:hypothetical protein [Gemmatimonadaceae bacterium]